MDISKVCSIREFALMNYGAMRHIIGGRLEYIRVNRDGSRKLCGEARGFKSRQLAAQGRSGFGRKPRGGGQCKYFTPQLAR